MEVIWTIIIINVVFNVQRYQTEYSYNELHWLSIIHAVYDLATLSVTMTTAVTRLAQRAVSFDRLLQRHYSLYGTK